jgi:hypothetical protein
MTENERENGEQKALQKMEVIPPATNTLKLNTGDIDLSGLSEEQISALKLKYGEMQLGILQKAAEQKTDVATLDAALTSFTTQTEKATQAGTSATIQLSTTSTIGRTEVMIGNTEKAAAGKISSSVSGTSHNAIIIIGIIAVAAVLIAFALGGR